MNLFLYAKKINLSHQDWIHCFYLEGSDLILKIRLLEVGKHSPSFPHQHGSHSVCANTIYTFVG